MDNKIKKIKLLVLSTVVALCLAPAFALAVSNEINITQTGDDNSVICVQDGAANLSTIAQTGDYNYVVTSQNEGGGTVIESTAQDQIILTLTY